MLAARIGFMLACPLSVPLVMPSHRALIVCRLGTVTWNFAVPLPASAMSPVTTAERLHAMALRSVASCLGARPDWILAVRTTFSKATAIAGEAAITADKATAAVYLVLMKGDFTLYDGGPVPSCAHAPTGHYFCAIIDAATFLTLDSSLRRRPPLVPLQTFGTVLHLS